MKSDKVIVKFEDVAEQVHGSVRRLVGFVQAKNLLPLFDAADLDANPRSAKIGPVTDAIIDSIATDPDIFPFKTKGVLLGASDYAPLDRKRYELRFADPHLEGILDGGHNMLGIGTHILLSAVTDPRLRRRIRLWDDFKREWAANREAIQNIRDDLTFFVPLEVLVPADLQDDAVVEKFRTELFDVCAARNNNVELTSETKFNQRGYYDEIREALRPSVEARIEWKTNTPDANVKVRDIIALAWIPLSLISLPDGIKIPNPQGIYGNKGDCAVLFGKLMGHEQVSVPENGSTRVTLRHEGVRSAIRMLGDLTELYDTIYASFPDAYNSAGGHFGRLSAVRMWDPARKADKNRKWMRSAPRSHFTEQSVSYDYPDGLIMPLVWGLRALMEVRGGCVGWKTDPKMFLVQNFEDIARGYKVMLSAFAFDPQKLGKNEGVYHFAEGEFEKAMLKQAAAA